MVKNCSFLKKKHVFFSHAFYEKFFFQKNEFKALSTLRTNEPKKLIIRSIHEKTEVLKNKKKHKNFIKQSRYYKHYKQIICPDILLKKNIKTITELPNIQKIIITTTSKAIVSEKKNILPGLAAVELFSGQKLKYTSAHQPIAGFKLRKNQLIGCKVTLRREAMYGFLEKLITVLLPRNRDYHGVHLEKLKKSNYNIGLHNLLIIPELENHFEYFEFPRGVNITIVINGKFQSALLSGFQLPITY